MRRRSLGDLLAIPKLTPAHRRLALLRMEALACERGLSALRGPLRAALQTQDRALQLEQERRQLAGSHALHAAGARALDAEIDRALSGLHGTLTAIARSFQGPRGQRARSLLDALFPQGVGPIARLPYVDQHAAVQRQLEQLRAPELAEGLALLELQEWAALLEQLNADFGQKLVRPRGPTWAEVRAADQQAFASLLSVVALVLGLFPSDEEQDREPRQLLLAPLEEQRQALSTLRARQRRGDGGGDDGGQGTGSRSSSEHGARTSSAMSRGSEHGTRGLELETRISKPRVSGSAGELGQAWSWWWTWAWSCKQPPRPRSPAPRQDCPRPGTSEGGWGGNSPRGGSGGR